jgi:hypothetical protein
MAWVPHHEAELKGSCTAGFAQTNRKWDIGKFVSALVCYLA